MPAVQAAIMLMADENREVLQTLLCFLSDVTSSVEENQMTPMNLAVCLAPSLFHLNLMKNDNLSPRYQACILFFHLFLNIALSKSCYLEPEATNSSVIYFLLEC